MTNKLEQDLTLIILPSAEVERLDLLKVTKWLYVENCSSINELEDIEDSIKSIKQFYGNKYNESLN